VKLILQIAAGTVLAWLAITGINLLAARAALHPFSAAAPPTATAPARSYAPAAAPPPILPAQPTVPAVPELPPETNHTADSRQWSITTTDGKHYSGTGPAPQNGLPQPQPPQR
jgi:hypothetical protein